ncbi:putative glycosyl transferase [Pelagibacter phage HTVC111P]|jgi:ADP-heptose:LPS heptosyltransferase|nr:putative glycosyl transferase [Pelagibacter phage HTVC111P]BAQ91094.1 putative glycosyl transferase [uncultured Mediterranean phage uvMED]BAQ91169.1 putative glycosyl transferase [uncultured Mediterranean phage uvMED]BAR20032.1 putative glycosyl transferase [uncultured Mediterranean phage uvMED]BAR20050.1 putative glycosyl transferase [uncultured Mediterranean phage uvMED]
MLNTYVVEGGVGKCVAFTSLIPKLRKKSEVQIYTPYIDCFAGNPDVKLALEETLPLQDPRIMASDNIYYSEPYKSNFQFGKQHLIESYCELHNVDFDKSMKPKIYTDRHKDSVKEWLDKNEIKKYILIQLSGGQSKWNYADGVQYQNINPNRNYQPFLAQQLINMLLEEYKDTTIINCVLPNEPHYQGTIRCDLHWSQIHEMLKGSEGFISIDSCLNHFSASAEKHGVVIWGSTRWTQFGYSHNKNLQFHMTDKWIEEKFIDNDPRNNMVEPKLIIDEFKKLDTNKAVALATE